MSGVGMSVGMGMLYSSLATGAMSKGAAAMAGGGGGEMPGMEVTYIDEYDDYQANREKQNKLYSGAIAGDEPDWMKDFYSDMMVEQERKINEEYLGTEGNRGNSKAGLAFQTGSITGMGEKAIQAQMNRIGTEAAGEKTGFAASIAKLRAENRREDTWKAAAGFEAQPRNPEYVTNYGQQGGGDSGGPDFGGMGEGLGAAASWGIQNMGNNNSGNTGMHAGTDYGGFDYGGFDTSNFGSSIAAYKSPAATNTSNSFSMYNQVQ